jgi:hypothetical protein
MRRARSVTFRPGPPAGGGQRADLLVERVGVGEGEGTLVAVVLVRSPVLQPSRARTELPPLPTFRSGGHLVDIADREQLYHAMEGR